MLYFRSILIVLQKRPFSERRDRSLENLVTPSLNSRFFGADCQSRRGRRGEEWSGDACVAHGGRWEAAGEQDAGRPKGPHPSSLPPPPLRDYETNPLPCSFHKIPTLERIPPPHQVDRKGQPYYTRFRFSNVQRLGGVAPLYRSALLSWCLWATKKATSTLLIQKA